MADSKLTGLTELAAEPAEDDWLYIVDKSDTTDDAAGSSRKIEVNRIGGIGTISYSALAPDGVTTDSWALPGTIPLATQNLAQAVDMVVAAPFVVTRNITITKAAVDVTTAQASSNARVGIYNANQSTGEVTTLVNDIGTIATTAINFQASGTLSISLAPAMYWAVYCNDTANVSIRSFKVLPLSFGGWFTRDDDNAPFVNRWTSTSPTTPSTSGYPADATSWTWTAGQSGASPSVESYVLFQWTVD